MKLNKERKAAFALVSYINQERVLMSLAEKRMREHSSDTEFCKGMAMLAYALGYDMGKDDNGVWTVERDKNDRMPRKDFKRTVSILADSDICPFGEDCADCEGKGECHGE